MRSHPHEVDEGSTRPFPAIGETENDPVSAARIIAPREIDLLSVAAFEASVSDTDPTADLVVDMRGTEFCGSEALRVLIGAHQRRTSTGARVIIDGPRPNVVELLELTRLDQILEVRPAGT